MPLYRAELLAKKPLRYAALIHDVSQVLYLPFDYDDGSYARDRSGYQNHGVIYGASRTAGKIGMALVFDGIDDHVEVPDDPTLRLQTFTIGTTVKVIKMPPPGVNAFLISKGNSYSVGIQGPDRVVLRIWRAEIGGSEWLLAYGVIEEEEWVDIDVTFDAETLLAKMFIDSEFKASKTFSKPPAINYVPLYLASFDGASAFANVVQDSTRLYNRVLSQAEIRMLRYRRI